MNKWANKQTNGDQELCPIFHLICVVQQIRKFVARTNDDTPLYSMDCKPLYEPKFVTNNYIWELLHNLCHISGGKKVFGFNTTDIGNKNIWSGVDMILFLMNHSSDQIMILGQ